MRDTDNVKEVNVVLNKFKYITLIVASASIAVTVLFYLLIFDNIFSLPMRWVSLLFLIIAEAACAVKAFTIKPSIFGVSNIVTGIAHTFAVLILSIAFVNFFPLFIKKYILINILLFCILLIADVVILFFSNHVSEQNSKLNESQSVMRAVYDKAAAICAEFGSTEYKKSLEEIAEALKYSDNSCLSQDEITILNKLDELSLLLKSGSDEAAGKITEINNIIKLRSIKVASAKRGSY